MPDLLMIETANELLSKKQQLRYWEYFRDALLANSEKNLIKKKRRLPM